MNKQTRTKNANPAKGRPGTDPVRLPSSGPSKTVHNIAPSDTVADVHIDSDLKIDKAPKPLHELVDSEAKTNLSVRSLPKAPKPSRSISSEIASDLSYRLMSVAMNQSTIGQVCRPKPVEEVNDELEKILEKFESESNFQPEPGPVGLRLKRLLQQFSQGRINVQDAKSNGSNAELARSCSAAIHSAISAMSNSEQFQKSVQRECNQAIYSFAYGLSHEINNPLANIAARAQQLIATASTETDRRSLATIVDQTMRAHEMLAEMMRVVQPRSLTLRTENVGETVREMMQRHSETWKHSKIQVEFQVGPKPCYAAIERAALTEALLSLLHNAMQVCGPNDRIQVFCGEAAPADGNESEEIRIAVSDTGPGLSHESAQRAWDLYYSGREHGRGLGISLANVRRIIDAHDGDVWIESAPGAGCVVEIRMPKSPETPTVRRQPIR